MAAASTLKPNGRTHRTPTGAAVLRVLVFGAAGLFLASAAVSTWASVDRTQSLVALASLAAGLLAAGVVVLLAQRDGSTLAALGFASLVAVAVLSEIILLGRVGNAGPYSATIAVLLPLSAAAVYWSFARGYSLAGWGTLAVLLLCLVLAVMGPERAPVFALAIGTVAALALFLLFLPGRAWKLIPGAALLLLAIMAGSAYMALVVRPSLLPVEVEALLPGVADRVAMWHEAIPLVQDYAFTGSGLAAMTMVHASYAVLSHVPYLQHVHNQPMQIAVEQGVIGLAALVTLYATAIAATLMVVRMGSTQNRRMAVAILASLLTLGILGLVEGELTLTPFQLVAFLPMGAAWSLHRSALVLRTERVPATRGTVVGSMAAAALVLALVAVPALALGAGSLYANLAAVEQQRVELAVYDQATWSFQDRVRRAYAAELTDTIAGYERALTLDPQSVSAHRRLGQIHLSMGASPAALSHLLTAASQDDSLPTLLLLGEALALTGDTDRAGAIWSSLELGQDQLWLRWAWHDSIGDTEGAKRIEEAARMRSITTAGGWQ